MQKHTKLFSLILALVLLLNISACTIPFINNTDGTVENTETNNAEFDTFLRELFIDEVTANTINLNYSIANYESFGITDYDITYGDFPIEELDDTSELVNTLEELKSYDYDTLSESQKLTYDIMYSDLTTSLEYSDLYLYEHTLSPTIGLQSQLPVILAEYSFRTAQDVYDYLELIEQTEQYFDFILQIEQLKSEEGLFMTDAIADEVIEQCNSFISDPENNYLIEIFNDKVDAMDCFSDSEKADLKTRNYAAVTECVVPAYALLIDGLTALKGTNRYDGGLCNYPEGKRYYEYLIKSDVGSSKTIEELDELVDEYIYKGYTGISEALKADRNLINTIDSITFPLTDPVEILEDLKTRIAEDFPEPPECNYSIKYVHDSLKDYLSPAFYMVPPVDDITNNVIYINTSDTNGTSDDNLYPTLAHEGYPGHLYQHVYTNSTNPSEIRSLFDYSGYSEGWATYVELYSYEMGAINKNAGKALAANQLIILCMYAKIDIGINYYDWDLEQTRDYLYSMVGTIDDEIVLEIYNAMISEPANYLNYVIGCIEIMELKEKAMEQLGDNFDIKEFHRFLLETGSAPFGIIEERMNTWMESHLPEK